mmetsp:Transcript_1317/g.3246  ORF Transcript_1317/g.3246 Transcript_1317/m.3246 type:complete len:217 (-) Transcript_1317:512-1162(-)
MHSAMRSVMRTAPIGSPPANGFAKVMISGNTPLIWYPKSLPVLPKPHWTSSKTSRAPTSSQRFLNASMKAFVAGMTPPSPCMGSTKTAQTVSSMAPRADASLNGRKLDEGIVGWNGVLYASLYVNAKAPMVRPWKALSKQTKFVLGLPDIMWNFLENLIAASLASVPELQKNALSAKEHFTNFSPSVICSLFKNKFDVWHNVPACLATTSTQPGSP